MTHRAHRALAAVWIAAAIALGAWGFLVRPGSLTQGPAPGHALAVNARVPAGSMISLPVRLDAPPRTSAWVVLGSTERWGPSAERYWRRQIHPGWNLLTWDDLGALTGREPLTIRLESDVPLRWTVGEARVASRYGLTHLTPI